ncbi:MAG: archaetidylserine decarboxylase [Deltaproteobacteria bacterium]|nr:archaetidylserine decarboxylase [Deltaproteobacteria bacterium]
MKYLFFQLLPKNLLSRLMGVLADIKFPSPFLLSIIKAYSYLYGINMNEMAKSPNELKNFNEFFTRKLKPELRPIDPGEKSVISPVDGTISEFGAIKEGLLTQTKGIFYTLEDLVGEKYSKLFEQGYFITIYLSPADYHRIHTPVSGKVSNFNYFSGNLWPVNRFGVEEIGALLAINERIVTPIKNKVGIVGLVKVGALVVGKITLDYSDISSNSKGLKSLHLPVLPEKNYDKGDEIGKFMLGSTVILLFQKNQFKPGELHRDKKIRMGEKIGEMISS